MIGIQVLTQNTFYTIETSPIDLSCFNSVDRYGLPENT